jgi:hypothetical protein
MKRRLRGVAAKGDLLLGKHLQHATAETFSFLKCGSTSGTSQDSALVHFPDYEVVETRG